MGKRIIPVLLCMALLLSACGAGQTNSSAQDDGRQIEELPTAGGGNQVATGEESI